VGEGPFPTELNDDIGYLLQEMGAEFGATTGRPRRCGWFDLVIARYAVRINGLDFIALTKLDVLDQLDTIKICTSYEIEGKIIHEMPGSIDDIRNAKPVYKEYPGWKSSTAGISNFIDLPDNAKKYIEKLELLMDCPIALISTGPSREQCIIRKDSDFFSRLLQQTN
jgi:adenylosuccinate synthase